MKAKMKSLRIRMLLPVIVMALFVVIMLTVMFSRAYISMILQQEQEVNDSGFDAISGSIMQLINSSVIEVRSIMADDRVAGYTGLQFDSLQDQIHARIACRDYLRSEITRSDGIFGVLIMREDGSLFGVLPEGNIFLDDPQKNPLPENIKTQILSAPHGQTVWVGPVSGASLYGFKNDDTPGSIMIAAWKSVDVRYGTCYGMLLIDETILDSIFAPMKDGKSTWRLFTAGQREFYHTGENACLSPNRLIANSNSRQVFDSDYGVPVCAFSMTMSSPDWMLVREISMENYQQVVRRVRTAIGVIGIVVLLIALAIYRLWLKKFMLQFDTLLNGIIRMGKGELQPVKSAPYTISEFETMQQEIDRTSIALNDQMETICRMERERAGHEYPAICKKDGLFEIYKDRHGFVIGGMEGVHYREYTLQMNPGDKIFVYTDGVPEATNGSGEMFGVEHMTAALNSCADGSPTDILRKVRSAVDDFVGDAEQFDDLTMMCMEYKGADANK